MRVELRSRDPRRSLLQAELSSSTMDSTAIEGSTLSLNVNSVICGHHIYMYVWTPTIGEILQTARETK